MDNKTFDFSGYLKHLGVNAREFSEKTGIAPNTLTKWKRLDSDEKIMQGSILKILVAYPKSDISKYFPVHAEIMRNVKVLPK